MIKDFQFKETMIHGLWEIQPFVAEDCRGQFVKDYSEKKVSRTQG